jgi:Tfp pilus assembly protein PilV
MTMQHRLGKKNRTKNLSGMSLIEALVATVVVGVGLVTVLQLAAFVTRSVDISIEKNKVNYLSEMMMEDMLSDRNFLSFYQRTLNCGITTQPTQNPYDLRINNWQTNFKGSLDGGLAGQDTRCTGLDRKQVTFVPLVRGTRITFISNNGRLENYLGAIIK